MMQYSGTSNVQNLLDTGLEKLSTFFTDKLPGILVALAILIVGWIVAKIIGGIVRKALARTGLSTSLGSTVEANPSTIETWGGKIAYYLAFLFVLVAFFQRLGLSMVSEPLNRLLSKVFEYLPSVMGAIFLLIAAWALATVAKMVVEKVLNATNLDERLGAYLEDPAAPRATMAGAISTAAYWLVWLFFLPAIMNALQLQYALEPVNRLLEMVLGALPKILVAVVILVVSWYLAGMVRRIVSNVLARIGFNELPARMGLNLQSTDLGATPADVAGRLSVIVIMLFAAMQAAEAVQFNSLSGVVREIISYAGNVIRAIIVLGIGFYLANLIAQIVRATGNSNADLLAKIARFGIIALAVPMALRQALPNDDILDKAFMLLLGAIAVAIALAFGLGGRETAGRIVEDWRLSLVTKRKD
jgi:hypothetical protein